jgi:eukaryotic-like serine/threonine-protein kinase
MLFIRRINSGGFGEVDEVQLDDGSRQARKTYAPTPALLAHSEDAKLRVRFKREARVQSLLDAQFFMPILSVDLDAAAPYYLMPLADRNFDDEIQSLKASAGVPQQAFADILNSLEKLHDLGYVHRDLKPQNVLLHDGVWKLSDFGLVLPPLGGTTKLTSLHSAWGTSAYCAPEQTLEFGTVTPAVDIYAYGCILHDVFVGTARIPYQRHTGPGAIGTIIEKCTEVKAGNRFHSIEALRSALLPLVAAGNSTVSAVIAPTGWAASVAVIAVWDTQKFRDFVRYMEQTLQKSELSLVLLEVAEDDIQYLYALDSDVWTRFADAYCEWVDRVGFDFGVCDVVVRRLEAVFQLGETEIKAKAVLAAAELGHSHNRWFVMGKVLKLCGAGIDDLLAQRISIEIVASDAKRNFRSCAEGVKKELSAYHPAIAAVLI